uniref:tRNA-dihydrouridine(47) synthase [NAD(P)(+)] n=1 Tax=Callorhinchus milii TaxID=7868 RepID=V9KGG6_CALMI
MAEGGDVSNSASTNRGTNLGVALIKPQYLTNKDHFHEYIESGNDPKNPDSHTEAGEVVEDTAADELLKHKVKRIKLDEENSSVQDKNVHEKENGEMCPKEEERKEAKRRARGQNKHRPHMKPNQYQTQKLCSSVCREPAQKCYYGDKCRFLHDVSKYLETKPADLGDRCYLYDMFGKCQYGISCRYAKSHIGANNRSLVNEDLVKKWQEKVIVQNSLSKQLQQVLRKKKFSFNNSDRYLKQLNQSNECDKKGNAGKNAADSPSKLGDELSPDLSISSAAIVEQTSAEQNSIRIVEPQDMPCCTESKLDNGLLSEAKQTIDETNKNVLTPGMEMGKENSVQEVNDQMASAKLLGAVLDEDIIKLRSCEKKTLNFKDKLYLAPLTTCGNLPFRRICKRFGADITCGEMAMCTNLLQGQSSEWALLKRHYTEDIFGVQLEGAFPDTLTKCAELLNQTINVDFVDINVGCPIDLVYHKGGGCGLMNRLNKFEQIVKGMNSVLDVPLTVKIRTGVHEKVNIAHKLIPNLRDWGVSLVTLHGRSREQRYTKLSDWDYINDCARLANPMPLFGNGDILSFEDANKAKTTGVSGIMIARGALIKPWIFTEIKEQRHWDISSQERFEILQDFRDYGLEHWGSDTQGVEKSRTFLLEWLSFLCRYIPVGVLEHVPQKINERPPYYLGRDYLETLMASQNVYDWIKISEMLLGPVPSNFTFLPKHKANAYK